MIHMYVDANAVGTSSIVQLLIEAIAPALSQIQNLSQIQTQCAQARIARRKQNVARKRNAMHEQ